MSHVRLLRRPPSLRPYHPFRIRSFDPNPFIRRASFFNQSSSKSSPFTARRIVLLCAVLSPAAFVKLSDDTNASQRETYEDRMLHASTDEQHSELSAKVSKLGPLSGKVILWLDRNIYEPIATCFRFLHLFVVFIPVILSTPAIWIGSQQGNGSRSGQIWWYGFLVKAMERAGPAFIKVCMMIPFSFEIANAYTAWPMGCQSIRHISRRDVQDNVFPPFQCATSFPSRY
jgi:hypothetical protein